jgi:hypothetical protein
MAINTAPDNPEQLEAIDLAINFFVSHLSTRFSYATLALGSGGQLVKKPVWRKLLSLQLRTPDPLIVYSLAHRR